MSLSEALRIGYGSREGYPDLIEAGFTYKEARYWYLQSLFPTRYLFPQNWINLRPALHEDKALTAYVFSVFSQAFDQYPHQVIGYRSAAKHESLGKAPFVMPFGRSQLEEKIPALLRHIRQHDLVALFVNHLPEDWGSVEKRHFAGRLVFAPRETRERSNVFGFDSEWVIELLAGEVQPNTLEKSTLERLTYIYYQKAGVSGFFHGQWQK